VFNKINKSKIASVLLLVVLFSGALYEQAHAQAPASGMTVGAAPQWTHNLGTSVLDQPYLFVESVVLANTDGNLRSFHMSGTFLWTFEPAVSITPHIARSLEGAVYFGDNNGLFRAMNRTGRELWRVNLGTPITHSPVVGWDGRVFISTGSTVSSRTASGHALWSVDLESTISVSPALGRSGSIAMMLENGEFVRISPFGAVDRIQLDQQPLLFISVRNNVEDSYILFFQNGQAEKVIFNANAARGNRLSRAAFPAPPVLPAAVASVGDRAAVTLSDGRVMLLDISGQVLWIGNSHETAVEGGTGNINPNVTAMVFDERGIYVLTTRGTTAFAIDGRRRFVHRMPEAVAIPGFSDEGMLYVVGPDQNLRVYKLDARPRTAPRSRFFGPNPEGNYGMGNPPSSPWALNTHRFNYDQQNMMFARVQSAILSGQIGEREPLYKAYIMEMVSYAMGTPHASRVRSLVPPPNRVALIQLLGRIGSRETVPFLWNIFDRDPHPSVRAAVAEAIGNIGVDPTGRTLVSFNFFLTPNNPNLDPQLLMSSISSIAALSRFAGPPLSQEAFLLLRRMSLLSWVPPVVRNQILREIDGMFRTDLDVVIGHQ
jgi:outer membrane protein assembly factor BamB